MMRNKLTEKVQILDKNMNSLLKELDSYTPEQLSKKPNENSWSPIQIIQHLILSEKLSLAYCKKKLSFEPKLKKANLLTAMNGKLVSWALASPIKFKAPATVRPPELIGEESLENLLGQWVSDRKDLLEFMETIPEKYIDKEVYKHPLGMRLSLSGMLDFFKSHFRHHRKQLFRSL